MIFKAVNLAQGTEGYARWYRNRINPGACAFSPGLFIMTGYPDVPVVQSSYRCRASRVISFNTALLHHFTFSAPVRALRVSR